MSDQVRLSVEKVEEKEEEEAADSKEFEKLTTSKIAKSLGVKTGELTDKLLAKGLLQRDGDHLKLSDAGKKAGGEFRFSKRYGPYFLWPKDFTI